MKRWKDPFPKTPEAFHDRVEQTLRGLEDADMRENRSYRKLTVALVAAIVALLTIGAVAAVIGNNQLKQELSDAGVSDMAERVQEVHLTDAGDGFNFAVDEIVWEGEDLYISYTLSVPEDGKTYLAALLRPKINGEQPDYRLSRYLEDFQVMAMGGDYPAAKTFVLPVIADSREIELHDMKLGVGAAFFETDRPLEYIPDFFEEGGVYETSDLLMDWDRLIRQRVFKSADTLYYWNDDDGSPLIDLDFFPEVLGMMDAEGAEEAGYVTAPQDPARQFWKLTITPAGLDSTGIASLVAERGLELPLSRDMISHDLYNGLEENTFRYNDMTIIIENFHMTHFKLTADIWIIPDGGIPQTTGDVDFRPYPSLFIDINDKNQEYELYGGSWGGIGTMDDGVRAYHAEYFCDGYIPLGDLRSVKLVARRWDEDAQEFVDPTVVGSLKPILDETAAEEEANALATREAAGSWQPGDPDIIVWANKDGTFYHLDKNCSGMRNAVKWHIANVVEAGKKPCPVCAGGKSEPAQLEEGEDISCDFD